jgi:hypothetical protein
MLFRLAETIAEAGKVGHEMPLMQFRHSCFLSKSAIK